MSNIQLLIEELNPAECNIITESSTDGKDLWLNGIMMQSSIKNKNGRVYPITEINAAVENAKQRIRETKGILGELDHPASLNINLDRVSHVIIEMSMSGTNAVGKAKILNTPMGIIGKELVKSGVAIGMSSRGAGSVNESGSVEGFQFVTVDIVATPSAPNAYPNPVYESLEMAKNGKQILSLAESVQHDQAAQKFFKKEFQKWLNQGLFAKK